MRGTSIVHHFSISRGELLPREIETIVLPGCVHAARLMTVRVALAKTLIETDAPLSDDALNELRSFEPVISARQIEL